MRGVKRPPLFFSDIFENQNFDYFEKNSIFVQKYIQQL